MDISVIIPTHNPRRDHLERVLAALSAQTLPKAQWELIIIDNASQPAVTPELAHLGHPAGWVVREERLGLTVTRLAGFAASSGEIVVLVDDDNVLAPDYLAHAISLADEYPKLGAWSGEVVLEFEPGAILPPLEWRAALTERHVSSDFVSADRHHHESTPWGAGLCVRRAVCDAYTQTLSKDPLRRQLDLHGQTLLYGGDTDIAFVGCAHGFTKGVFARFTLTHLISARRCETSYLLRSIEGHAYSSVLHEYIISASLPPYFTNPIWRFRQWLNRATLPRAARLEAAARARGYARAVRAVRQIAAPR